ncbi:MAG: CDP-alcohol phosphatidyltransferase family protein [Alphaproteobacteria bacterium]|nr:CDP-alcohol phosphatidyltransferase family protein [Alphaproteobacteria bacterium]
MTDRTQPAYDGSPKRYLSMRNGIGDARIIAALACVCVFVMAGAALPSMTAAATALFVYGVFAAVLLFYATRAEVLHRFGWANVITNVRLALAAILAGAIVDAPIVIGSWWLGGLAAAALLSDGLDGLVARRRASVSSFGAHFDREVDAGLVLILGLLLWFSGKIGIWIVAAGLMRYLLLVAGLAWPRLAMPLPESRFRSAVCGILVAALVICLLPVVDSVQASVIGAAALSALTLSFGKDLIWLLTKAPKRNIS